MDFIKKEIEVSICKPLYLDSLDLSNQMCKQLIEVVNRFQEPLETGNNFANVESSEKIGIDNDFEQGRERLTVQIRISGKNFQNGQAALRPLHSRF